MADTCERRQRRKGLGRKNLTILRNLGQVDVGGGVSFNQSHQQGNGPALRSQPCSVIGEDQPGGGCGTVG